MILILIVFLYISYTSWLFNLLNIFFWSFYASLLSFVLSEFGDDFCPCASHGTSLTTNDQNSLLRKRIWRTSENLLAASTTILVFFFMRWEKERESVLLDIWQKPSHIWCIIVVYTLLISHWYSLTITLDWSIESSFNFDDIDATTPRHVRSDTPD